MGWSTVLYMIDGMILPTVRSPPVSSNNESRRIGLVEFRYADAMSKTRLQDECNTAIRDCDVLIKYLHVYTRLAARDGPGIELDINCWR